MGLDRAETERWCWNLIASDAAHGNGALCEIPVMRKLRCDCGLAQQEGQPGDDTMGGGPWRHRHGKLSPCA